jgi:hypothetical protein
MSIHAIIFDLVFLAKVVLIFMVAAFIGKFLKLYKR